MYKNNVLKLVCLFFCFSVIPCQAMRIKNIFLIPKNIFKKQVRKYNINEMKRIYCSSYYSEKTRHDTNIILTKTKEIYNQLKTLDEKANFLYFMSYHASGLRAVGDCRDSRECDEYGRKHSALVHEILVEQYKEECKKEGMEYLFPGTYKKHYEIWRDKR